MNKIIITIILTGLIFFRADIGQAQTVYLTVDDGPLGGAYNIMRALEKERVPATFFVVGSHVEANSKRMKVFRAMRKSPWVQLANHSYHHAHGHYKKFYSNFRNVLSDLRKADRRLGLGGRNHDVRMPGRNVSRLPGIVRDDDGLSGSYRKESHVYDALYMKGYRIWGWDYEWAQARKGKARESIKSLVKTIVSKLKQGKTIRKGHLILLMHDRMFRDSLDGYRQFRNLVKALKQSGVKIKALKDYPI